MKEMWDYENGMMGAEKIKRDSSLIPKGPVRSQPHLLTSCGLCGGNHETTQCPHESRFSQLGEDLYMSTTNGGAYKKGAKPGSQCEQSKKQPVFQKLTQNREKKQAATKSQSQRKRLTTKNVSKLSQEQDQLDLEQ